MQSPSERRLRAYTAIQPSGDIHLGNYLGAIRPWVDAQDQFDGFFAIADLHALTVQPDPLALRERTRRTAALLLACGVDPDRTVLFAQSHIPAHSDLAWILGCLCPSGWLLRMAQFRERTMQARRGGDETETAGAGVLFYPVLMAADILLYDADVVPVGEDQRQHLELCRRLVRRIHRLHGDVVRMPEARIAPAGARVMGLDDPTVKMSKSITAPLHRIGPLDPPEHIRKAIAKATTDSGHEVAYDPVHRPGLANLLSILAALRRQDAPALCRTYAEAGRGYGDLKRDLTEAILEELTPIRQRCQSWMQNPGAIDAALADGARRADEASRPTLRRVRAAVGLLPPAGVLAVGQPGDR
jgi:tryptophanyl-tRNA synthetase